MNKKIVLSSSMKFRPQIKEAMAELEAKGFTPLFPNLNFAVENPGVEFTIELKKQLAETHYRAMREADAIYFILPEGYMGTSCKIELGYAYALGKPIYFSELTGDIGLDSYPKAIIPLDKLDKFLGELS